jgi:hypothetical protein
MLKNLVTKFMYDLQHGTPEEFQASRENLHRACGEVDDNIEVGEIIKKFPVGTKIVIEPVLEGNQYYVGYKRGDNVYVPGIGSYYPLAVALKKCFSAYVANEMMTVDK